MTKYTLHNYLMRIFHFVTISRRHPYRRRPPSFAQKRHTADPHACWLPQNQSPTHFRQPPTPPPPFNQNLQTPTNCSIIDHYRGEREIHGYQVAMSSAREQRLASGYGVGGEGATCEIQPETLSVSDYDATARTVMDGAGRRQQHQ